MALDSLIFMILGSSVSLDPFPFLSHSQIASGLRTHANSVHTQSLFARIPIV